MNQDISALLVIVQDSPPSDRQQHIRQRLAVRALAIALAFITASLLTPYAWAYDVQPAAATVGAPKLLVTALTTKGKNEMTKIDGGSVAYKESTTTKGTWDIEYTPPTKLPAGKTDEFSYTANDGTVKKVSVALAAAASTAVVPIDTISTSGKTTDQLSVKDSIIGLLVSKLLLLLFVLATVIESGLAVIFRWSPFLKYFDTKGVKPVVSFLFAWLFVSRFDLDIAQKIAVAGGGSGDSDWSSQMISALVLAGGSGGVNSLMVALGWRSVVTAYSEAPKLDETQAWLSVSLLRGKAAGPVLVFLVTPTVPNPGALLTTIEGRRALNAFWRLFLRDPCRYPPSGGYLLTAGQAYRVIATAKDSAGDDLLTYDSGSFTPAPRALINFNIHFDDRP